MKELRNEVGRLRSDFEQKWSSQIKMVSTSKRDPSTPVCFVSGGCEQSKCLQNARQNGYVDRLASFSWYIAMHWHPPRTFHSSFSDKMLNTNILQSGLDSDSMDQLQNKLKRYSTAIEALRGKGIGKLLWPTLVACHRPGTLLDALERTRWTELFSLRYW